MIKTNHKTGLEHWGYVQTAHLKFPPTGKPHLVTRCECNPSVVSDTAKQAVFSKTVPERYKWNAKSNLLLQSEVPVIMPFWLVLVFGPQMLGHVESVMLLVSISFSMAQKKRRGGWGGSLKGVGYGLLKERQPHVIWSKLATKNQDSGSPSALGLASAPLLKHGAQPDQTFSSASDVLQLLRRPFSVDSATLLLTVEVTANSVRQTVMNIFLMCRIHPELNEHCGFPSSGLLLQNYSKAYRLLVSVD